MVAIPYDALRGEGVQLPIFTQLPPPRSSFSRNVAWPRPPGAYGWWCTPRGGEEMVGWGRWGLLVMLPTIIFQGRAVELRGCKCSSYIHNITPMMIASAIKELPLPQPWQSRKCVCFQPLETSGSWQDSKLEKLAPKPKGFSLETRCHTMLRNTCSDLYTNTSNYSMPVVNSNNKTMETWLRLQVPTKKRYWK